MRRRTGRQSSSSSLHIYAKEMSGINNIACGQQNNGEPRVVVQTLPAVEPSEERLTPAPPATTPQQLAPAKVEKDKDTADVEEVRTRLRPNRSSWKHKYASPDPQENKKVSNTVGQKSALSPEVSQHGKSSTSNQPRSKQSTDMKQDRWSYMNEDVASIKRNTKLAIKRDRTPSTDSAPESPLPQKRRGKLHVNIKVTGKPKNTPHVLKEDRNTKKQKVNTARNASARNTHQNGKPLQSKTKQNVVKKGLESQQMKLESKGVAKTGSMSPTDAPGFCEFCGEEFAFLNLHFQTKHTQPEVEPASLSKPQTTIKNKPCENETTSTLKQSSSSTDEAQKLEESNRAREEAIQIARMVKQDALIQKFGVRLLGMSLYPQQKVLAVSQRMIELVRLLRAAQCLDPTVQSLTQLMHCNYWPIIIEAIMYVAGYQHDEGTFRNPVFVFDVGQALKFTAHILKNDAIMNCNLQYEQELKDFMNSIDSKIEEILPGITELRPVHFLDSTGMENVNVDKTEVVRTETVCSEDHQVQELLSNITVNASDQCSNEYILSDVLDEAVTSVGLDPNFAGPSELTSMPAVATACPVTKEGEQQASLLLEFSKAQMSTPNIISQSSSAPQIQTSVSTTEKAQTIGKLIPVSLSSNTTKPTNILKLVKTAPPSTNANKLVLSNNPSVRYVKIVSSKSSAQGQSVQRKYCLLIPSQTVQKPQLAVKRTVQNVDIKMITNAAGSTQETLKILPNTSSPMKLQTVVTNAEIAGVSTAATSNPNLAALCGLQLDSEET